MLLVPTRWTNQISKITMALGPKPSPQKVLDFLLESFRRFELSKIDKPKLHFLLNSMRQAFTAFPHLNRKERLEIQNKIREHCAGYQIRYGRAKKSAPSIHYAKMMNLANHIKNKHPGHGRMAPVKALKFKMISLMYKLSCAGGLRWIDTVRLRWEDVSCSYPYVNGRQFCHINIMIRITKADFTGSRSLNSSFRQIPSKPNLCPVLELLQFWEFQKKPVHGFIFQCSQMPKGQHGHVCANALHATAHRIAVKELHWRTPPTKHTPRVSALRHQTALQVPMERIPGMFHWVKNSEMPEHYLGRSFAEASNGPAALFAADAENDFPALQTYAHQLQ